MNVFEKIEKTPIWLIGLTVIGAMMLLVSFAVLGEAALILFQHYVLNDAAGTCR